MGPAALCLAWLASLAPVLLERGGNLDLTAVGAEAAPRTALAALPWLALAGLPRARRAPFSAVLWWGSAMACVPVLVLCAALDRQAGVALPRAAATAAWGFAFIALSALAADCARGSARGQRLHGWIWTALFLGVPLLAASLRWGARAEGALAPAWSEWLAKASPLAWAHASIDGTATPFAPLFASLALAAACAFALRESPG